MTLPDVSIERAGNARDDTAILHMPVQHYVQALVRAAWS